MSVDWIPRTVHLLIRQAWVAIIASGLMLFSPWIRDQFHLNGFMAAYGSLVSVVFIVAMASLPVTWLRARKRNAARAEYDTRRTFYLTQLSPAEKSIMREFVIQGQNTLRVPIDEPNVAGLLAVGVLVQVGRILERCPVGWLGSVRIADEVWIFVRGGNLIDLPDDPDDEANRRFVFGNRPPFIRELEEER